MRYLAILLLCSLLEQTIGRPQAVTQENYRDAEEIDYENDDDAALEDSRREDDDAAVDEKANNKDEGEAVQPRHNRNFFFRRRGEGRTSAEEHVTKETVDNFSELKTDRRLDNKDEAADNDEDQPEDNNRHNRYSESRSDDSQFVQESDDQRDSAVVRKQQRKGSAQHEENNDMLYENNDPKQEQADKIDKNKRNHDTAESAGQSRYYNQYYNRPQTGNRESQNNPNEELNHDDINRDRRNVDDPNDDGTNQDAKDKKDIENIENEAEQAIIQRYVKKLNKKEVDELMSTLSEDKRKLLQQIIDNDGTNQAVNLNKREITKKAGAVEENNFMDGVQSDSNKISEPLINLNMGDALSQSNDVTGMTTAAQRDQSTTNIDENKIMRRSTSSNEETVSEKLEIRTMTTASTESLTSKSDSKREVNINDFSNEESQEALQDEPYAGTQDEDLAQLMDDDAQLHYEYRNPQKRDLTVETDAEMAEPMKSLQESFSNANSYEDSGYYGDSNMAPLVRVKRRNNEHAVKKRDASILPESKVGYVPENEDEDGDEGNEFYDDGFFDRTANFAKSNSRADKVSDSRHRLLNLNAEGNQSVFKRSKAVANDVARDTSSIGSDTDSVLSGVEGADENLMYNGGNRKKRAVENIPKLEPAEDLIKADMFTAFTSPVHSSSASGNVKPEIFGASYNDNEGFGPSSRSYDGELSRIKRIRRLKQHAANKSHSFTEETVE